MCVLCGVVVFSADAAFFFFLNASASADMYTLALLGVVCVSLRESAY